MRLLPGELDLAVIGRRYQRRAKIDGTVDARTRVSMSIAAISRARPHPIFKLIHCDCAICRKAIAGLRRQALRERERLRHLTHAAHLVNPSYPLSRLSRR